MKRRQCHRIADRRSRGDLIGLVVVGDRDRTLPVETLTAPLFATVKTETVLSHAIRQRRLFPCPGWLPRPWGRAGRNGVCDRQPKFIDDIGVIAQIIRDNSFFEACRMATPKRIRADGDSPSPVERSITATRLHQTK